MVKDDEGGYGETCSVLESPALFQLSFGERKATHVDGHTAVVALSNAALFFTWWKLNPCGLLLLMHAAEPLILGSLL